MAREIVTLRNTLRKPYDFSLFLRYLCSVKKEQKTHDPTPALPREGD